RIKQYSSRHRAWMILFRQWLRVNGIQIN
ncbi:uncharacterized protein METZ01_LOCUS400134, partial [marine metagenome]